MKEYFMLKANLIAYELMYVDFRKMVEIYIPVLSTYF
jgi:hypothetical protein